jgi:LAO/AO transport system kinase
VETVASTGEGLDALWAAIGDHRDHQVGQGHPGRAPPERRLEREFRQILSARLDQQVGELSRTTQFIDITDAMVAGGLDPYEAADRHVDRAAGGRRRTVSAIENT